MLIDNGKIPYHKGMLLEAEMLNRDFSLAQFLALESWTARTSDGIASGLNTIAREDASLYLQKGLFKLDGRIGWLLEDMDLKNPPEKKTCFLCLEPAGDKAWKLDWKENPEKALVLCRIHIRDRKILRNSWHIAKNEGSSLQNWLAYMQGQDYVQLEYAMAASFGKKPSLLPEIQRELAPFAKRPELAIWLMNGMLPIMDYFAAESWQNGIERLLADFMGEAPKKIVGSEDQRSII